MNTTEHTQPMLAHIIKDPWTYLSTAAAAMVLAVNWIAEYATPIMGLLAGIGGLAVLLLGILEKRKKNKLLDLEIKIKEAEYRSGHGIY